MAIIPIIISGLALLASGVSLYYQFFYKPRRLRIITMPFRSDGTVRFGVCNGGKESVYITGLSVDFSVPYGKGLLSGPVGKILQLNKSIINPGSIIEFSYKITDPSETLLKHAQEQANLNGDQEKKVDIVTYIQFAFPDGTVYSNQFKSGEYSSSSDNSKGYRVEGININLLKGALPVLRN